MKGSILARGHNCESPKKKHYCCVDGSRFRFSNPAAGFQASHSFFVIVRLASAGTSACGRLVFVERAVLEAPRSAGQGDDSPRQARIPGFKRRPPSPDSAAGASLLSRVGAFLFLWCLQCFGLSRSRKYGLAAGGSGRARCFLASCAAVIHGRCRVPHAPAPRLLRPLRRGRRSATYFQCFRVDASGSIQPR